jgi:hypothetical protein
VCATVVEFNDASIEQLNHRHRRLLRAPAAVGHVTAAPLSAVMNFRRPMRIAM